MKSCRHAIGFFILLAFVSASQARDAAVTPKPVVENKIAWYDASQWQSEGRGWDDTSTPFTRMPARAQETVPPSVWKLGQQSAGLIVRFKTDAPTIMARHEVGGPLAMTHMTAVGRSGLDLYARDPQGVWRWAGFSKPNAKQYEQELLKDASKKLREYMLYLPPYNNTVSLSVGVPEGSRFEALPPSDKKPVFYYGTSIAQGCSASRPGMTIPALLGRRLDRPVVNFGFSGTGRMEAALADLIGEVDAAVFVLDCLPNMSAKLVSERAETFIRKLRQARPDTPIVLVEDRTMTNAWLKPGRLKSHADRRKVYRTAYDKLTAEGFKKMYYVEGDHLLGDDNEGTIDSSHPTDVGMMRQTDILEPILRQILDGK